MIVAVEDTLSEEVIRKILARYRPDVSATTVGLKGKGYLKARARELNRAAVSVPVIMVVDLDTDTTCVPDLTIRWFGTDTPRLLFRIAVMEVEAWVLADRRRAASFLAVPERRIPINTEEIAKPKEFVVGLARRSQSSRIRQELVPESGSTATIGPAYNARLIEFVVSEWDPERASASSSSLARAVSRVREHPRRD